MKKTRKTLCRITISCLAILLAMGIFGCSQGETAAEGGQNNSPSAKSAQPKDAIKIDQIEWETASTVNNGERRVEFTFDNKSSYLIAEFEMSFAPATDATIDDIKPSFTNPSTTNSLLSGAMDDLTDSDLSRLRIYANERHAVDAGTVSDGCLMSLGSAYLTSLDQLGHFNPDMLTIKYVSNDKLYEETYDFVNESYSLSKTIEDVNDWPENDFTNTLPSPEGLIVTETAEKDGNFSFETIGTSEEAYWSYIDACKEKGFTDDISSFSNDFDATSNDGQYRLETYLYSDGELHVTLKPNAQ